MAINPFVDDVFPPSSSKKPAAGVSLFGGSETAADKGSKVRSPVVLKY